MFCKLQPFMSGLCTIACIRICSGLCAIACIRVIYLNLISKCHCREVFLDAAKRWIRIEGAEELLQDVTNGVDEVYFQVISFRPLAMHIYSLLEGSHVIFAPKGSGRTQQVFI